VPDSPFAIPWKLGRSGLSEVVNHLLELPDKVSFDFMINNILIKVPLRRFLSTYRLTTENVIVIEYMPSVIIEDNNYSADSPAWIGSIDHNESLIALGCYDGSVQLFDASKKLEKRPISAHQQPIRAVRFLKPKDSPILATASKDHSIKIWSITNQLDGLSMTQEAELIGHSNSVESLCSVSISEKQFLFSGDWNGNLLGWNIEKVGSEFVDKDSVLQTRKKSKLASTSKASFLSMTPSITIKAHSQSISELCHGFLSSDSLSNSDDPNDTKLFSCSWDHSMKLWNIETQDCISIFTTSKVFTSLHYSSQSKLAISSHPDGKCRLWDPRKKDECSSIRTFGRDSSDGVASWLSQVSIQTLFIMSSL
jgi:ribosome biogenesis protein YTM1